MVSLHASQSQRLEFEREFASFVADEAPDDEDHGNDAPDDDAG